MRARKTTLMRSRATTLLNYTALFSSRFVHPRTFKFFRSLFTTFSRAMSPCMDAFSYWCFEPSQPQRITSGLLHGRCLFFFYLGWLSLAVLYWIGSRFLARLLFMGVSRIQPEDMPTPLSKTIVYSKSWVRNFYNTSFHFE